MACRQDPAAELPERAGPGDLRENQVGYLLAKPGAGELEPAPVGDDDLSGVRREPVAVVVGVRAHMMTVKQRSQHQAMPTTVADKRSPSLTGRSAACSS